MNGEADFATQVLVRVVDRMMRAELELEQRNQLEAADAKRFARLHDLLESEPEYAEQIRKTGAVNSVDAACEVIERLRKTR